jgi:hypothetical protein
MNVISLKISLNADDICSGEMSCFERYSKLSTLDPLMTCC